MRVLRQMFWYNITLSTWNNLMILCQFSKTLRKIFECKKTWMKLNQDFCQKIVFSRFWRIGKVSSNYSMCTMWCIKTSRIQANFKTIVKELRENRQKLHFSKLESSLSVRVRFPVLIPPNAPFFQNVSCIFAFNFLLIPNCYVHQMFWSGMLRWSRQFIHRITNWKHFAMATSGESKISQRGANPKVGCLTYYFTCFCWKLHQNERNWTERGSASFAPPRSATGNVRTIEEQWYRYVIFKRSTHSGWEHCRVWTLQYQSYTSFMPMHVHKKGVQLSPAWVALHK